MVTSMVEVRYEEEADAAYIYLVPHDEERFAATCRFCDVYFDGSAINVDLSHSGKIIGFEILGASKVLPPHLLR